MITFLFPARKMDMENLDDLGAESEGADHCGGIPLGGAWLCGKCTAKHQCEKAERHFVPEARERGAHTALIQFLVVQIHIKSFLE